MKLQEEIDNMVIKAFEYFSEAPEKIRINLPAIIPQDFLRSILLETNRYYANVFDIEFSKSRIGRTDNCSLDISVSDPTANISDKKPDLKEFEWAEKIVNIIQTSMKDKEDSERHFSPYIRDPDGFRPSCLKIYPDREQLAAEVLSALFRKHAIVKDPRLVITTREDGEKKYFLKSEVSHKTNTGYGPNSLGLQKSGQINKIMEKTFQEIKNKELQEQPKKKEKQHKTKGKSRHL